MSCDALAFGPHPDDVEIGCGGTVAKLCSLGYNVRIVDLSAGELATNGTVSERAKEAAAAAEVLGVGVRENLALPDGGLSVHDDAQVRAVAGALRRHRPSLVLAPWLHARHPDHEATSAIVRRAAYLAGLKRYETDGDDPPHRPGTILWYPLRVDLREPALVVDIGPVVALKRAAIKCHASQVTRSGDDENTLVNQLTGQAALVGRELTWGALIGADVGEAFAVDRTLGVSDPVAFFGAMGMPTLFPPRRS